MDEKDKQITTKLLAHNTRLWVIGWLTCIPAVLLPHSLCRSTTANVPAGRQMPIASVVRCNNKKKMRIRTLWILIAILTNNLIFAQTDCEKAKVQATLDFQKSIYSFHSEEMLPV